MPSAKIDKLTIRLKGVSPADARRLDQVAGRLHDWTESEVADFARALHRFRISIESQTNGDDTL